jgi:hypothetical protein
LQVVWLSPHGGGKGRAIVELLRQPSVPHGSVIAECGQTPPCLRHVDEARANEGRDDRNGGQCICLCPATRLVGLDKRFGRRDARAGFILHTALDDRHQCGRQDRVHTADARHRLRELRDDHALCRLTGDGERTGQGKIRDQPKRVEVAASVDHVAGCLFEAHELRRAYHLAYARDSRACGRCIDRTGDPEIADVLQQAHRFPARQGPRPRHAVAESFPFHIAHGEGEERWGLLHGEHRHEVRM